MLALAREGYSWRAIDLGDLRVVKQPPGGKPRVWGGVVAHFLRWMSQRARARLCAARRAQREAPSSGPDDPIAAATGARSASRRRTDQTRAEIDL